MSQAGIDASMAGTTLRNILSSLLNPSSEAAESIEALGITIVGANGKMLPFEDILAQIPASVLDTAEGIAHLNTIFGERGTPGLIELVRQGADRFNEFKQSLEDSGGAAKMMAETRLDNLKGAFTLLKSSLEGVGIALVTGGEQSLAGSMKTFISDSLIPMVNATGQWIEQVGGLPGMIKMAWEIVTAFAGEVKQAFVNLFTDWETFKQFAVTFGAMLDQAIYAITQFALKLTVAIGGVFFNLAETIGEVLLAPVSVLFSQLKEVFVMFLNWLGPQVVDVGNQVLAPFRWALDKMGVEIGAFDWTPLTVEPALKMEEVWPAMWEKFGTNIKEAFNYAVEAASGFGAEMKTAGSLAAQSVEVLNPKLTNFGATVDVITAKYKVFGGTVAQPEIENQINNNTFALGRFGDAMNTMPQATEAAVGQTNYLLELMQAKHNNVLTSMGDKIHSSLVNGWDRYIASIHTYNNIIADAINLMGDTMGGAISSSISTAIQTGHISFHDGMKAIGDAGAQAIGDALSAEIMRGIVGPAVNAMIGLFSEGFSSIGSMASGLASTIGDMLGSLGSAGGGKSSGAGLTGLGTLGGLAGFTGIMAGAVGIVALVDALWGQESKSVQDQLNEFFTAQGITAQSEVSDLAAAVISGMDAATAAGLSGGRYIKFSGSGGTLGYNQLSALWNVLPGEAQSYILESSSGASKKWFEAVNGTGSNVTPQSTIPGYSYLQSFHTGGIIPFEGLFRGLSGEGVLNRDAMGRLGEEGLAKLNQGGAAGETYIFVINAMDGTDVERVIERRIIPSLREKSKAGVEIIHENGIRHRAVG
jgi:hypothetical protein